MSAEPIAAATPTLDIDFVRSQFPAFSHPDLAEWVHFENAGGSYVSRQVIDLLTHFYTATKVQPYGPAGPARAGGDAMDRARVIVPATFNANPEEVHFGPSTSQNTYVLARAIRPAMSIGDEVVVTNQDHEANIGSWRRLAETGLTIREWSVNSDTGLLDVADLESQLSDRTKLVCVTHASNLAATINPIRQIADVVHSYGALLLVDGVSWAPHDSIDVQALGCDFYLYSTYKTYGPHLGLMYVRREVLDNLANQGHYFNATNPTAMLTPAGPDHAAVAATAGIVDYYEALYQHHFAMPGATGTLTDSGPGQPGAPERIAAVYRMVADHEERLMTPLFDFLATKDVKVIGSTEALRAVRAPTIAFTSTRTAPRQIAEALAAAGIGIGSGDFYARRLADALQLADGVVRMSMVHYNTVEEIDRAIAALDPVL